MVARSGKASWEATGMHLNQNRVHWGGEDGQIEWDLKDKKWHDLGIVCLWTGSQVSGFCKKGWMVGPLIVMSRLGEGPWMWELTPAHCRKLWRRTKMSFPHCMFHVLGELSRSRYRGSQPLRTLLRFLLTSTVSWLLFRRGYLAFLFDRFQDLVFLHDFCILTTMYEVLIYFYLFCSLFAVPFDIKTHVFLQFLAILSTSSKMVPLPFLPFSFWELLSEKSWYLSNYYHSFLTMLSLKKQTKQTRKTSFLNTVFRQNSSILPSKHEYSDSFSRGYLVFFIFHFAWQLWVFLLALFLILLIFFHDFQFL